MLQKTQQSLPSGLKKTYHQQNNYERIRKRKIPPLIKNHKQSVSLQMITNKQPQISKEIAKNFEINNTNQSSQLLIKQSLMQKQSIYLYVKKYLNNIHEQNLQTKSKQFSLRKQNNQYKYQMYRQNKQKQRHQRYDSFINPQNQLNINKHKNNAIQHSSINKLDKSRQSQQSRMSLKASSRQANKMLIRDIKIKNLHKNGHQIKKQVAKLPKTTKLPKIISKRSQQQEHPQTIQIIKNDIKLQTFDQGTQVQLKEFENKTKQININQIKQQLHSQLILQIQQILARQKPVQQVQQTQQQIQIIQQTINQQLQSLFIMQQQNHDKMQSFQDNYQNIINDKTDYYQLKEIINSDVQIMQDQRDHQINQLNKIKSMLQQEKRQTKLLQNINNSQLNLLNKQRYDKSISIQSESFIQHSHKQVQIEQESPQYDTKSIQINENQLQPIKQPIQVNQIQTQCLIIKQQDILQRQYQIQNLKEQIKEDKNQHMLNQQRIKQQHTKQLLLKQMKWKNKYQKTSLNQFIIKIKNLSNKGDFINNQLTQNNIQKKNNSILKQKIQTNKQKSNSINSKIIQIKNQKDLQKIKRHYQKAINKANNVINKLKFDLQCQTNLRQKNLLNDKNNKTIQINIINSIRQNQSIKKDLESQFMNLQKQINTYKINHKIQKVQKHYLIQNNFNYVFEPQNRNQQWKDQSQSQQTLQNQFSLICNSQAIVQQLQIIGEHEYNNSISTQHNQSQIQVQINNNNSYQKQSLNFNNVEINSFNNFENHQYQNQQNCQNQGNQIQILVQVHQSQKLEQDSQQQIHFVKQSPTYYQLTQHCQITLGNYQ